MPKHASIFESYSEMVAPSHTKVVRELDAALPQGLTPDLVQRRQAIMNEAHGIRNKVVRNRTLAGLGGAALLAGGVVALDDWKKRRLDKRLQPPTKPPLTQVDEIRDSAKEDQLAPTGNSGYSPPTDAKHATLLPGGVPGQVGSLRTMARGASFGLGNGMPGAVASRVSRARAAHPQLMGKVMDRTGEASGLNPVGRVVMNARRVPEAIKRRVGLGPKPVVTQTRVAHADLPPEVLAAMNKKGSIAPNTVREQPSFVGTTRRRGRDPGMEQVLSHPPKVVKNRFLGIPIGSMGKVATLRPGGMKGGIGTWRKMEGMALEGARAFTPAAGAKSHKGITALSKKTNLVKRMERASARHPQYVQGMSKGFEGRLGEAFAEGTSKLSADGSQPWYTPAIGALAAKPPKKVFTPAVQPGLIKKLFGMKRASYMDSAPNSPHMRTARPKVPKIRMSQGYRTERPKFAGIIEGGFRAQRQRLSEATPRMRRLLSKAPFGNILHPDGSFTPMKKFDRTDTLVSTGRKRRVLPANHSGHDPGYQDLTDAHKHAGLLGAVGRASVGAAKTVGGLAITGAAMLPKPKPMGAPMGAFKGGALHLPATRFDSIWRGEPGFQEELERQKVAHELPDDWAPRRVFVRHESPPMPAPLAGFVRAGYEKLAFDAVSRFLKASKTHGRVHTVQDLKNAISTSAHAIPRSYKGRFPTVATRTNRLAGKNWADYKTNTQALLPPGLTIPGVKSPDALTGLKG